MGARMSEITNTATIRVVADASGVEAGLRPATEAARRAGQAVSQVGAGAGTSARNVESAQRSIIQSIQRTTVAMESGGRQTAAYYEALARQRGIDPAALTPYLNSLRAVEQAQVRTGASAAQVANAMRMVPAQLTDIATQLAGGQSPFLILMQQGGQLRDSFGSIPATLRGVGSTLLSLVSPFAVAAGAAAGLAYAYSEGEQEAGAYNRALILSGNTAGTTAGQLQVMAKQISATVGTQGQAAAALAALAGTGKVGAENLQEFGRVAIEMQRGIGQSAEDTAKQFAELGKSPVDASIKLTETYHYLSAAVFDQIKALDKQGQSDDAAALAQRTYAAALSDRMKQVKDSLGTVQTAWGKVGDAAGKAWDQFLNIGRPQTIDEQIAQIDAQLARAKDKTAPIVSMARLGFSQSLPGVDKAALEQQRSTLVLQKAKQDWDAAQKGISQQMNDALIQWDKDGDKYLTKIQRRDQEIKKVREEGLAAGVSDKAINARVASIYASYASLDNPALKALENQRDQQREILKGQLDDLESNHKQQLISEADYVAKKRDLQVREIDLEVSLLRKKAAVDANKEDKSERDKDLSDLKVALIKRQNVIKAADNELAEYNSGKTKAVDALVTSWDLAIEAEKEAVEQEIALFGQSGQARTVALAQMKFDVEARKQIAAQMKDGHALTEQKIADLNKQADARKGRMADKLNEKAALAAANQLLVDNEKFSAQYIADADLRAQRITAIDAKQWKYLIDSTKEGSEARKLILEQFDAWMANRQMQPVLDRWKGVIDNLDNNFQEGFRDMLTGGKSAWSAFAKSIGNTLKTSIADTLYQVFAKKYVVQFVTSLAGAISGPAVAGALNGVPQVAGGASSVIGAAQMASSLYGTLTGGMTLGGGLGSGFMGSLAGGLNGAGVGSGLTSSMGLSIGNSILDVVGPGISGALASGMGAIATALPWVGGALAVVSLAKAAFGHGETEVAGQGIRGTVSAAGLSGTAYQKLHQDGGWFSSDRDWEKPTAFTDAMTKQFTQGLASMERAAAGFASSLGVQADWVSSYSKSFDLKLTGDQTKDQQIIADFFQSVGDEIAGKLVPNLDTFAKSGEALSATLERLAGDFKGTDQVAQLLGFSAEKLFGSTGLDSAGVREQFIDMAGGLSALNSEAAFFNQNFLTDAERIAPVAAALDKALASLGLTTIPNTRDEFKGLVNSLIAGGAAATESGSKQLASLLALGEAFAQVHPDTAAEAAQKASQILEERKGLQEQLDELTLSSVQLLAKQRDALDESNRALFDQIQGIKAQAAALQSVKDSASLLLGGVNDAFSVLQKVVDREKSAVQVSVTAQTAAVTKLQSLSEALHSTLDSYKSPDQQAAGRARAQAEIRADLAITKAGGKLSDAQVDSLKKALSAVTHDSTGQFGSYTDYLRDLYQTQNDIASLAGVTDDSLSIEQKSLDALNSQLTALDAIVANGQAMLDVLNGESTAALTSAQAMAALQSSIGAAQANPYVGSAASISSAYRDILGRAPDAAGLEYWKGEAAGGMSIAHIRELMMGSDEYKKLHPFAIGINSVPEDMPAMVHKGERIMPAADNRAVIALLARASSGGDGSALAEEVRLLRQTVSKQQAALDKIAASTGRHAEMYETATAGGNAPMLVEIAK
jgi:phage-related minor tail protein